MTRLRMMRINFTCQIVAVCVLAAASCIRAEDDRAVLSSIESGRKKVLIESTLDGHQQPCYVIVPEGLSGDKPAPLLVSLHSWSRDCEYRGWPLERLAARRGWIYLYPNFRGPNDDPDACGSEKAQQDILDAVAWAKKNYPIDENRIYLMGVSGGGHMTMQMAGCHPEIWAAASAWCGPTDLAAWHAFHKNDKYGQMMRQACGGAPGDSDEVDRQYRDRSPLSHLQNAVGVPLDINAGIRDGHDGSVPIAHSLRAFNVVANAAGAEPITEEEIAQLSRPDGRLEKPRASDREDDPTYGRKIFLRRYAGPARITIFDGGHEGNPEAAVAWLEKHAKKAESGEPKAER